MIANVAGEQSAWAQQVRKEEAALMRHAQAMQAKYHRQAAQLERDARLSRVRKGTVTPVRDAVLALSPKRAVPVPVPVVRPPSRVEAPSRAGSRTSSVVQSLRAPTPAAATAAATTTAANGTFAVRSERPASRASVGASTAMSERARGTDGVRKWAADLAETPDVIDARSVASRRSGGTASVFTATTLTHRGPSTVAVSGVSDIQARLQNVELNVERERALREDLAAALREVRELVALQKAHGRDESMRPTSSSQGLPPIGRR